MRISATVLICSALLACLCAATAWSDAVEPGADLALDRTLGDLSRERLADGSANTGAVSRLTPVAPIPPRIPPPVYGGVIALALGGLLAGILLGRRSVGPAAATAADPDWTEPARTPDDAGDPDVERNATEARLRERETALEDRESELERVRRQADAALAERDGLRQQIQALRLRAGPAADGDAAATDTLHAELDRLDGDPGAIRDALSGEAVDADLQHRFDEQKAHIRQLEELLSLAQDENEAATLRASEETVRREELAASLAHRDGELEIARQELERLRGQVDASADESQADGPASGSHAGRDDLAEQLAQRDEALHEARAELARLRAQADRPEPTEQVAGLERQLDDLRGERDDLRRQAEADRSLVPKLEHQLSENAARVAELEAALASVRDDLAGQLAERDDALHEARAELARLRAQVDRPEPTEQVAGLERQLDDLRGERDDLRRQAEADRSLVPKLERQLSENAARVGELEAALESVRDERDVQAQSGREAAERAAALQASVAAAEARIATLQADLEAAGRQTENAAAAEELARENAALKDEVEATGRQLLEARAALVQHEQDRAARDDWNSTVESLQAELRRKTALIDSQADRLTGHAAQVETLQAELAALRAGLEKKDSEAAALRELLAEAGNTVESLRDEIGAQEHAETRVRLALDPSQDPFSTHAEAVDPVEADVEALRFTVRSRRDLAESLRTILGEERAALEEARHRIGERDEKLVSLKNDITANRLTMHALEVRLDQCVAADAAQPRRESAESGNELRESLKLLDSMRGDLTRWRARVKPLHEALVARNQRITRLEAELRALRRAQDIDTERSDPADDVADEVAVLLGRNRDGESPEAERSRYLDEMKKEWDRVVERETELADTGARLARLLQLDETRCRQIEGLELARSAQIARIEELRRELADFGVDVGAAAGTQDDAVSAEARQPT